MDSIQGSISSSKKRARIDPDDVVGDSVVVVSVVARVGFFTRLKRFLCHQIHKVSFFQHSILFPCPVRLGSLNRFTQYLLRVLKCSLGLVIFFLRFAFLSHRVRLWMIRLWL